MGKLKQLLIEVEDMDMDGCGFMGECKWREEHPAEDYYPPTPCLNPDTCDGGANGWGPTRHTCANCC